MKKSELNFTNFTWFEDKLDKEFELSDLFNAKVIFGFNGIGKTTLYKILKQSIDNAFFIDYSELPLTLAEKKSKVVISVYINEIDRLKSEIEKDKLQLAVKKIIKDNYGISNQKNAVQYGEKILDAFKGNFNGFNVSRDDVINFSSDLDISFNSFFKIIPDLKNVNDTKNEIELKYKSEWYKVFLQIDALAQEDSQECPICGRKNIDLKKIIKSKLEEFKSKNSLLIDKMTSLHLPTDENTINNLLIKHQSLEAKQELLSNLLLCNGNINDYDFMSTLYEQISNKEQKLAKMASMAEEHYEDIIKVKDLLEKDLLTYFDVKPSDICYNKNSFAIEITFPREIKSYSTGELNLICFLYYIYSFIGSDKDTLILDDPVSSLDLINLYKIAYEICRVSNNKKIITFTHSVELVNVIASQIPEKFTYFYLEEVNKKISIQKLEHEKTNNPNIITLDKLFAFDSEKIIECMKAREISYENCYDLPFHYTLTPQYYNNNVNYFSNHSLIDRIDSLILNDTKSFFQNSYNKIVILASLRVWVEKKLYDIIDTSERKDKYLKKYTLQEKINVFFNNCESVSYEGKLYYRNGLMTKKVMLNQAVHFYSQIMPFAYSINLSIDDINNEILSLKDYFNCNNY